MDSYRFEHRLRGSPRLEQPQSPRFRWAPAVEEARGANRASAVQLHVELQPRATAACDVAAAAAAASSVIIRKVYYRGTCMPVDGWFQPCSLCRCWTAHTLGTDHAVQAYVCRRCTPRLASAAASQGISDSVAAANALAVAAAELLATAPSLESRPSSVDAMPRLDPLPLKPSSPSLPSPLDTPTAAASDTPRHSQRIRPAAAAAQLQWGASSNSWQAALNSAPARQGSAAAHQLTHAWPTRPAAAAAELRKGSAATMAAVWPGKAHRRSSHDTHDSRDCSPPQQYHVQQAQHSTAALWPTQQQQQQQEQQQQLLGSPPWKVPNQYKPAPPAAAGWPGALSASTLHSKSQAAVPAASSSSSTTSSTCSSSSLWQQSQQQWQLLSMPSAAAPAGYPLLQQG